MSVDRLQNKIRKLKSPIILDLMPDGQVIPANILAQEGSELKAYARFAMEVLDGLRELVCGVRFHFASFSVFGNDGMSVLSSLLNYAGKLGYYVLLDAPEALTLQQAVLHAELMMNEDSVWSADGFILSQMVGTDAVKPYVSYLEDSEKAVFAIVRTGNRSGPEMQDLITGGRLVHMAQADLINRLAQPHLGRSGFCKLGVVAAATSLDSLQNLRSKYKYLFIIVDGYDYSNANAKNCAAAFDKLGHGAVVCVGSSILGAWKSSINDGDDFVMCAQQAADKVKKNISRYIAIL